MRPRLFTSRARIDEACGDPSVIDLVEAIREHDWATADALVRTLPSSDDRSFCIDVVSSRLSRGDGLASWVAERPDDALPRLVRGFGALHEAWEARGGGQPGHVTGRRWKGFRDNLVRARRDFEAASRRAPDDPEPWAGLVAVRTALGRPLAEIGKAFGKAWRRDREHVTAHRLMLAASCEKWCGSHRRMFGFARSACEKAGEGSPVKIVLIAAHIERQLHYALWEDKPGRAVRYFEDETVAGDVARVARELQSSDRALRMRSAPRLHNTLAYALWQSGDRAGAAWHLDATRGIVVEMPWGCFDDALSLYRRARRECRA